MADEVQVRSSLFIKKSNLQYQSPKTAYKTDMDAATPKGPTPGAITVTTYGTDVSLAELTEPGWCEIINLDTTNYVEVGVYDPETDVFTPHDELGPGESYVRKLSRNFREEYDGTGTGTTSATNRLRIKANTASCVVIVNAFER